MGRIPPQNIDCTFPVEMIDPFITNLAAMAGVRLQSAAVVAELEEILTAATDGDEARFVDQCPHPHWAPQLTIRHISSALVNANGLIANPLAEYTPQIQEKFTRALDDADHTTSTTFETLSTTWTT